MSNVAILRKDSGEIEANATPAAAVDTRNAAPMATEKPSKGASPEGVKAWLNRIVPEPKDVAKFAKG